MCQIQLYALWHRAHIQNYVFFFYIFISKDTFDWESVGLVDNTNELIIICITPPTKYYQPNSLSWSIYAIETDIPTLFFVKFKILQGHGLVITNLVGNFPYCVWLVDLALYKSLAYVLTVQCIPFQYTEPLNVSLCQLDPGCCKYGDTALLQVLQSFRSNYFPLLHRTLLSSTSWSSYLLIS